MRVVLVPIATTLVLPAGRLEYADRLTIPPSLLLRADQVIE